METTPEKVDAGHPLSQVTGTVSRWQNTEPRRLCVAAMLLMFALVGCGNQDLTRSMAKQLLEPALNQEQWSASIDSNTKDGSTPLTDRLIATGYITITEWPYMNLSRLTAKGERAVDEGRWQCTFVELVSGLKSINGCSIFLTTKIAVEITGITSPRPGYAVAAYRATGVLSEEGKAYVESGVVKDEIAPRDGRANFVKYDDGWRLTR